MIKTVIFDLGNVLVNYDAKKAGIQFARECKLPLMKVLLHFFTSPVEKAYTQGEISSKEFYEHSKKVLKFPISYRTFARYWNDIFEENPGMYELLKKLKKKYPLYLISNTNKLHFDYIKRKFPHICKQFKKTFPSHEVGCRKPDVIIYQKVIKKIGVLPDEAVFIDDVKKFVDGAKKAGLHAVRFKNPQQLVFELRKLGVEA